ncbi:sodium-dependent transporter bedraggled isoform X2 [Toxorhynchites rutilus septentrionalis]|uniref:sodium-dependent transporter bedraggled isoform X2 n=1 Tax=Toxorhynchites rutilus septentrionalis TaxID=329112 RepID=UPI002479E2A2|nr:sodium-dependent transporter bedraggled isoform X2 [Toxorhynchites rutilus septentrionalis]
MASASVDGGQEHFVVGGDSSSAARHFCTLKNNNSNEATNGEPSVNNRVNDATATSGPDTLGASQFCTLRVPKTTQGTGVSAMGNAIGPDVRYFRNSEEDDHSEANRNLLYEENMCTFENLCERSSDRRGSEGDRENGDEGNESVGNFCTLRKKRVPKLMEQPHGATGDRVQETTMEDNNHRMRNPIGSYCTLKKKKLKLNQKFVENFLEDPNAKLHDYLSELDAYLDEMDGLDECDDESEGDSIEEIVQVEQPEEKKHDEENDSAASVSIGYIDIKNFCTLPKQQRVQFLNAFNRAGPLRRTFVAPSSSRGSTEREVISEADESSKADRDSVGAAACGNDPISTATLNRRPASGRASSWLRNSMRKTRPITLPDQAPTKQMAVPREINSINSEPNQGEPEFLSTDSLPSGSSVCDQFTYDDHNELSSIATLPVAELEEITAESSFNSHHTSPTENESHQTEAAPTRVPSGVPITEEDIIPNLMLASICERDSPLVTNLDSSRPRQTGRRSESRPRVVSITAERDATTNQLIIRPTNSVHRAGSSNSHHRNDASPSRSQPEDHRHPQQQQQIEHHRYRGMGSETSSIGSSRNPSPMSLLSTTTFSSIASGADMERSRSGPEDDVRGTTSSTAALELSSALAAATHNGSLHSTTILGSHGGDDESESSSDDDSEPELDQNGRPKPKWPHVVSRSMATSFCALGLCNISRFAMFSIHFGANFIVQFLIFSFLFGIPMLWLQMVLGARIKGGPVTMWRISPICKGIGIALILAQGLISLYSAISLSWVLVYFRDSFVSRSDKYRWQDIFEMYRGPGNQSFRLSDTVADYFNGVVLQRHQLSPGVRGSGGIGAVRFQLAFNLAILWTFVFVVLCKGIRSFGKIVIGLFSFAMVGMIAICSKFLSMVSFDSVQSVFPATEWQDFFLNSRSWMSAAQETFLTWGLLGVSVYSINCRTNRKGSSSRIKRELRRDALLVVVLTLTGLLLAAIFGSTCVQILNSSGYYYFPGSYENIGTDIFLLPADQPLPPQYATMPTKWLIRYSMVLGENFKRPYANPNQESGYQVLRLVTELFPSTLAAATQELIAPIWSLVGYLTLLLFGLGQLCAMWKPIAGAIGDSPSAIVLSCVTGLFMGIPLATESGITIIHYFDTILGGAWWLLLLWAGHILAIFLVRGRPFTSDLLVNDLRLTQSLSAFIAFAWNFLLPIGMIFLCILQYRVSNANTFFNWKHGGYWPLWARQFGGFVQVSFLLLVPVVTIVQIYRYLSKGPPDILDRFDLLLRPSMGSPHEAAINSGRIQHTRRPAPPQPVRTANTGSTMISLESRAPQDDAPPKYTPPPSYTTATGARIAKMLRNSIRRSVRRIMGETSGNRQRGAILQQHQHPQQQAAANPAGDELSPPDYSSVLTDLMNQQQQQQQSSRTSGIEMGPRVLYNSETLSGRRRHRSLVSANSANQQQHLTANDVRQILRPATISAPQCAATGIYRTPSFVSATSSAIGYGNVDLVVRNTLNRHSIGGGSVENLVLGAAPIGDSSIITLAVEEDDNPERGQAGNDSVI